jgi:hypothetical protein
VTIIAGYQRSLPSMRSQVVVELLNRTVSDERIFRRLDFKLQYCNFSVNEDVERFASYDLRALT